MSETVKVEDLRPGDTLVTTATVEAVTVTANGVEVKFSVTPPIAAHFTPLGTDIELVTHPAPPAPPEG